MPSNAVLDRPTATGMVGALMTFGVYSSFLCHAETAAGDYGDDTRSILAKAGRRKMVDRRYLRTVLRDSLVCRAILRNER